MRRHRPGKRIVKPPNAEGHPNKRAKDVTLPKLKFMGGTDGRKHGTMSATDRKETK